MRVYWRALEGKGDRRIAMSDMRRKADEQGYREVHSKACSIIIQKYEYWRKAMGISWKEYLSEIAKNSLTGEWAREVARHLIETENWNDVKNS